MKDVRVVAFDCDGVLFDSTEANTAYYNEILNFLNMPNMTPEQFAYAHMHTADDALAYLLKEKEMIKAAQAYQKQIGYKKFIRYMKIEPYLKPLLRWLRPRYGTAIATNRTFTMPWVLEAFDLGGYFDLIVSAKDVARPKPDPQPLIKILSHFEIGSHQALYVGDSPLDEMAAAAAGIPLVAYNNSSLSAAFHIRRLKELEDILEG